MGLKKLKLAVFISGRGSNMRSIVEACEDPTFPAEVSVVLSNRPNAEGLRFASSNDIPTETVDHKKFDSRENFEAEVSKSLESYEIDLIILAGFMRVLTPSFVEKWPDKIINIHPSLLPDYKGTNTHARALADGQEEAGCTVHYVIPELDSGKIIAQVRVPILKSDTVETLSERVLKEEHKIYPKAIEKLAKKTGWQNLVCLDRL